MMNFKQNEEAVSPVIGVILMVAITVILAAVIAAFVFGMTGNVQTQKTIAVTAGQNANDVVLTYQGGADASSLQYLKVIIQPSGGSQLTNYTKDASGSFTSTVTASANELDVGTVMRFSGAGTSGRDHVVVTGHFADGSDQVVLDTYL